ncbi:hypothetical protein [Georgenia subflava]|uniref:hypothetical protein n=1 Tax=Georgenia subflava TaxID=1622177 RepID=UPI00186B1955|nr:hypothetical protein [Georgenia subflava]
MDPSLIDAFTARSLGVPMDEMLRGRRTRLTPRRRGVRGGTTYLGLRRPAPGDDL